MTRSYSLLPPAVMKGHCRALPPSRLLGLPQDGRAQSAPTSLQLLAPAQTHTPPPCKSPPFPLFWSFYFQFVAIQPLLLYWGNHENEKQKHTLTYTTSSHKWYMSNISKLLQSHGYSEWLVMRFLGRVFARVSLSTLSPGFWNLTI